MKRFLKNNSILVKCIVFSLLLLIFSCSSVKADDLGPTVSDIVYGVVDYYKNQTLNNWEQLVALKIADGDLNYWINNDKIDDWDADELNEDSPATAFAGRILGLLALGQDPTNYHGQNLIEILKGKQQTSGSFGGSINNTIWSIIALEKVGSSGYNRDLAVQYLISQQKPNGGFVLFGSHPDPDTTGEALLALSMVPSTSEVSTAINKAKQHLQAIQLETAGFESVFEWDSYVYKTPNSQSTARVITGLLAVGEDILQPQWTKNNKTMIDALLDYMVSGPGPEISFAYAQGGASNEMATRQVLWALAELKASSYGEYQQRPTVRLRVEGHTVSLADEMVTTISSSVPEAVYEALELAVGSDNLQTNGSGIVAIKGESGKLIGSHINTSWKYYIIRDGQPSPYINYLKTGDEVIFYISAFDTASSTTLTKIPLAEISPKQPSEGQALTFWLKAKPDITQDETIDIKDFVIKIGDKEYPSDWFGQVILENISKGQLKYSISVTDQVYGYPKVVTYKGSVDVGGPEISQVHVRVEGAERTIASDIVAVKGTAMEALKLVLDINNITYEIFDGYIYSIDGETAGRFDTSPPTIYDGWMYLVNGDFAPVGANGYNVQDGDELVFYYGVWPGANGTLIPKIDISPLMPEVNENITVTVTSSYTNYWPEFEIVNVKISNAIVDFNGKSYITDDQGKVVLPGPSVAGTYYLKVSKDQEGSYPYILRTGQIPILVGSTENGTGGSTPVNEITVFVEIIGKEGTYFSGNITLPKSKANALEALKATGVSYSTRDNQSYVWQIAGEKEDLTGTAGWKYKVGNIIPGVPAKDYTIRDGDYVLWFWAGDYTATGPGQTPLPQPLPVDEDLEKAISGAIKKLEEAVKTETPVRGIPIEVAIVPSTVIGADNQMTEEQKKELEKLLKDNIVAIVQRVEAGKESNVTDEKNEINLKIGKDALKEAKEISVKETTADKNVKAPPTHKLVSSIYEFGPKGTVFNEPVYMSIRVVIPDGVKYEDLVLAWYNEEKEQWFALPTVVDVSTGTITGLVEHFTKFAVLAREKQPVQFADVSEEKYPWAAKEISYLATKGIIQGVGDNRFEPAREVNRAEFTAMLVKALGLGHTVQYQGMFEDVKESAWYAGYVQAAVDAGIIKGLTERTFGPSDKVTREQLAVMMSRVLGEEEVAAAVVFKDASQIAPWAVQGVAQAVTRDIFKGFPDETFRPKGVVSRAQSAAVIYRFLLQ
ncbi:MAG: S-layer homology domain-containing protein [Bacillota bacterium]